MTQDFWQLARRSKEDMNKMQQPEHFLKLHNAVQKLLYWIGVDRLIAATKQNIGKNPKALFNISNRGIYHTTPTQGPFQIDDIRWAVHETLGGFIFSLFCSTLNGKCFLNFVYNPPLVSVEHGELHANKIMELLRKFIS